ncbi:MAG TPA: hypothetical protein VD865_13105 [Stenotrophomonas sp.]|nr:hypothetical protein [Stenotrophomonas sp.]
MAAEHWLRWHHGTITDPKWRVIAARAGNALSRNVTVGHVVSVWAAMLECASQANPRGTLVGWCDEDVAAALGLPEEEVAAIRAAMEGKTVAGDELSAWKRRQPKAEDGTAAQRKQAQRERERAAAKPVTGGDSGEGHEVSRSVTTETETETEEKDKSSLRSDSSSAAPDDRPPAPVRIDQAKAERLGQVTAEAIAAFNASLLVKANGGLLASVSPTVGRERRQQQVRRCLRVARQISRETYGTDRVPAQFWVDYFQAVAADDFHAGRLGGGRGHENWLPDFEFLTQEKTMLKVYDRAADEAAA